MKDFRDRPKDNFIDEASWQQLYVLTEHWQSNLMFYRDDVRFLHHLINKYFLWLTQEAHIAEVREIDRQLVRIEKRCTALLEKTQKHLGHLSELMENPFAYDSHVFRAEHGMLEEEYAKFTKDFRKHKKEVFTITEHIVEGEKMVRQLDLLPK